MYVKALQHCVFAILIINSKQFPQEDVLHASQGEAVDGLAQNDANEISDGTLSDSNLIVPEKKSPGESSFSVSIEINPQKPTNETNDGNRGRNVPNEGYINQTQNKNDDDYSPDEPQYINEPENTESNEEKLRINYLDHNKPEPGFDLSRAEIRKFKLWPGGQIPYFIDTFSFSDKVLRDKIRSFLSAVNSLTSLNFIELPSPPNDNSRWVFFINRRGLLGCADHSIKDFTNEGVQHVVLGYHCMSTEGELAEAVLAIAGVPPQHNAPDRDEYIKINEQNILPEKKYLFEKLSANEWLFHDLDYDFQSAGHFNSYKHSENGRATIELQKKLNGITVGETKVLSATDIQKIRMLYNYIVTKKLLQATDCHKLFEPGHKFKDLANDDIKLEPRPKPYQYSGWDKGEIKPKISSRETPSSKNDQQNVAPHEDYIQQNEQYIPPNQENNMTNEYDQPENYDYPAEEQLPPEYNYADPGKNTVNQNIMGEANESENQSPILEDGMAATIISIASPPSVDKNSNQLHPYNLHSKKKGPVILSLLSDYDTDVDISKIPSSLTNGKK